MRRPTVFYDIGNLEQKQARQGNEYIRTDILLIGRQKLQFSIIYYYLLLDVFVVFVVVKIFPAQFLQKHRLQSYVCSLDI